MVPCSYHRTLRNNDVASAQPAILPSENLEGISGTQDRTLLQMGMQIRALVDKVEKLHEKLSAISPTSLPEPTHHPVANLEHAMELNFSHVDAPQATDSEARDQSMQANTDEAPETISPEYHGPTSSEFTFEVANESLSELGFRCSIGVPNRPSRFPSFVTISRIQTADRTLLRRDLARDPLWTIERSDALKYIDIYHNSVGAMYPVIDRSRLAPKIQLLFDALDLVRGRPCQGGFGNCIELLYSIETQIMKILVAIGMITELGVAGTDAAMRLMQDVLDTSEDSLINTEGLSGVQLLVSTALFYYNLDEEPKASRYACLASRRCLEMGLHRRDTLVKHFPEEGARKAALRIFWSVFTLDRRSSLGLGVPFVIQDSLVDPALVSLDFDNVYLRTMIPFAKLSGKAWQMSNEFGSKEPDIVREEIEYLDYQVSQWQKQIPASIRYCHGSTGLPDLKSCNSEILQQFYLSVALFVRSNQLHNVIYRPLLQSASRIKSHPEHILAAVNVAKDSLQVLSELDAATTLLETHATFFKHFIVSSLGNLLLIAVHATAEYWMEIRDTFHVGLTLLRKLSSRSGPVMRAWNRLKCLEELQSKILNTRQLQTEQQQDADHFGGISDMRPTQGTSLLTDCNVEHPMDGDDSTPFDSQIRDEFARLFDPSFAFGDFYEFPFFENDGRN
ncbi:uncharacterized protein A1O5_12625 [Cladophialophora psammophila CBS 110553]|uniref:Xylanolytic transcriptional activator regulatory domain-containing protein n=1 Tax=Cladophialophora psammophila CBS 110553 TaxID=1182543 RepID=W9VLH9_9EURO|nr:uncharacterized protein A1O5_12625 [Cladophialophora psammophila CBS 110553]EXJ56358.1 hypothetical protein A1O5_12625 [Cladophialophora psammophila CBS 110553]